MNKEYNSRAAKWKRWVGQGGSVKCRASVPSPGTSSQHIDITPNLKFLESIRGVFMEVLQEIKSSDIFDGTQLPSLSASLGAEWAESSYATFTWLAFLVTHPPPPKAT